MVSAPRLSIVVPVHDAAEHLPPMLEALAAQSLREAEFVLVDDGSRDASPALLAAFAAREPRARVLTQSNAGPSAARNAGIAAARGASIAFADADDWLAPDFAATVAGALADRGLDVLCFNGRRIDSRGTLEGEPFYRRAKPVTPVTGAEWIAATVAEGEFLQYVWLLACDAALARATPFVPGIVHEDVVFACELLLRAQRVGFLDRELYQYRGTPQSLMRKPTDETRMRRIEGYFAVVARLLALADAPGVPPPTAQALRLHAAREGGNVFRLARKLAQPSARAAVYARARSVRLASLLWRHARGFAERRRAARAFVLTAWR